MNPYYAEWVRLTGGGPNHEYIIWNMKAWSDWERDFNAPKGRRSDSERAEFLEWLRNK